MLSLRLFQSYHPDTLAALLAAGALGGALLSQYGFGYRPCDLCVLQRYPYAAIAVIGVASYLLAARRPRLARALRGLIIALFVLEAALAAYHVGVEQGWIAGPSACSGGTTATSLEALRAQLLSAPLVSCRDVRFSFLGLSMAAWNILYALASGAALTYVMRKQTPRAHP